ncbi:MAG TPA: quinone-dependent dihydroorotate dehydrogenase [Polyangiales bacterium]|nr:quinone-dependent dihydroorotate dehydrogenase [Polyangiales bacterium]
MYAKLIRPLLYLLPAETAHRFVMAGLRLLAAFPSILGLLRARWRPDPILATHAFGLRFPSPIGLAAGLDKDAEAFEAFGALGFGFVEVGTLTAQPQAGNPTPRLFRLPRDRALVNRMGFNNRGVAHAAAHIARVVPRSTLLGINIGKTKVVPNEAALDDYAFSARTAAPLADYLVVNVSSPNTPGLRDLQQVAALRPLLARIRNELDTVQASRRIPLLLKIAPDLADEDIDAIADLALELGLDGIIATNTTIARSGLASDASTVQACGAGGLSGAPLRARSLDVLRRLRTRVGDRVVLVAVGGIETADDAWQRILAGAQLVQLYTALIYEGPALPRRIAAGLADRARAAGFSSIAAAVGTGKAA